MYACAWSGAHMHISSPVRLLDAVVEHADQYIGVFREVHHKLLMLLYLQCTNIWGKFCYDFLLCVLRPTSQDLSRVCMHAFDALMPAARQDAWGTFEYCLRDSDPVREKTTTTIWYTCLGDTGSIIGISWHAYTKLRGMIAVRISVCEISQRTDLPEAMFIQIMVEATPKRTHTYKNVRLNRFGFCLSMSTKNCS